MAIKTVSVEIDAYDRLVRARRHPKESFSTVIRRARWDDPQYTGRALMDHLRERLRRGLALSDASLGKLSRSMGRKSVPKTFDGPAETKADSYLADSSFLLEIEIEVATIKEGSAMQFLSSVPDSVFRISIITYGEFMSIVDMGDHALGEQIVSRFELANLSPGIVAHYSARKVGLMSADNEIWVGCTALELDSPLLTQRPDRFAGIGGLKMVTL